MDHVEFYKTILLNVYEGIYFVDTERRITFWNGGAEKITGFSAGDVIGKRCKDSILMHVDETGKSLCLNGCPLHSTIQDSQAREVSVFLHHKSGHRVPVTVRSIPIYIDQHIAGAVEIFVDDSERHEFLENTKELKTLLMLDQLTSLPNRRYIDSFLSSKYKEFRELGITFGMLFIDVDRFKVFNDTYGHDVGDKVLQMIARTFLSATRGNDLIGRFGGEEFIAILAGVDEASLVEKAERLRMLIENGSIMENQNELRVTISIGATIIREEDTVETLIKRADKMLYRSKEEGRNRVTTG
jgi:diguanylate cyclase (GGDEF)-like protein/PAS domain S-box-containing protein